MRNLEIAGQTFKTKSVLLKKLRDILHAYKPGQFVSAEDAAFLSVCLEQANHYYGYPVERGIKWRVQEHSTWKNSEFVFYREDGTRDNPSIKRLSQTKAKGPKKPKQAARHDIADQILEFRSREYRNGGYHCAEIDCDHVSSDVTEFEVDHILPFSELWEIFLNIIGAREAEIGVVEHLDDTGVMVSFGLAYPFDIAFKGFHRKHAKLQLLCRGCHAAKTYKYVSASERGASE